MILDIILIKTDYRLFLIKEIDTHLEYSEICI